MALFEYRAAHADGTITQGRIDAGGRGDALRIIEERGLTPLRLAETAAAPLRGKVKLSEIGKLKFPSKRVPFAALEDFTRSLSSLLTAGVALSRALTILYKETSNPAAAAKWKELHDLVVDGVSLADAMKRSPDVFPNVYVAM